MFASYKLLFGKGSIEKSLTFKKINVNYLIKIFKKRFLAIETICFNIDIQDLGT